MQTQGEEFLLGINVLRNDADAAMAIAAASGANFVRINVHNGVMACDQGLIEGTAADTLRKRRHWDAESVQIMADVGVKHAIPFPGFDLAEAARDLSERAEGLPVDREGDVRASLRFEFFNEPSAVGDHQGLVVSREEPVCEFEGPAFDSAGIQFGK